MTQVYTMPAEVHAPDPAGESPGHSMPWVGQAHDPMPALPFDRAAIVEWMHHIVEERVPDGFPLPWDHAGPCHDPGPTVIPL